MYPWKHHYGLNPETYDPVPCLQTTQKKAFKYNFERGHTHTRMRTHTLFPHYGKQCHAVTSRLGFLIDTKIPTNFVRVHPS